MEVSLHLRRLPDLDLTYPPSPTGTPTANTSSPTPPRLYPYHIVYYRSLSSVEKQIMNGDI